MDIDQFIDRYPRLFHMAEAGAWPSIQEHGLRSAQALLDLFGIDGDQRSAILDARRAEMVTISHPTHGTAYVRDNKPLRENILERCLVGMTAAEWYRLLNSKAFFWVSEERLDGLLAARSYKGRPHDVITVDTASLLDSHGARVTVAPFNTGSTLYPGAPARGRSTFSTISDHPGETTRTGRHLRPVVELTVAHAVTDIAALVLRCQRREAGQPATLLWTP
jgi:hypothetical protein